VDLIEVFTTDNPAPRAPRAPRPRVTGRQVVAGSVLALGALVVAVAVIWSDRSSSGRSADPVATTTTMRPLLRAAPAPLPIDDSAGTGAVRFAADPPAGWTQYSADVLTPSDPTDYAELWADAADTAGAGRWILLQLESGGRAAPALDATRSLIGGFDASTPADDPSLRRVEVPVAAGLVTITARNFDDALLAGITAVVAGTAPSQRPPSGLTNVIAGNGADVLIRGEPLSEVIYTRSGAASPVDVTLTVGRAPSGDPAAALLPYLLTDLTHDPAAWTPDLVTGTLVDHPDRHLLRWLVGEYVLTLEGPVSVEQLRAFATTVQPVDAQRWEFLLYGHPPGVRLLDLAQVASGATTGGRSWLAGVRLIERGGTTLFLWAAAPLDSPQGPPFTPPIEQAAPPGPGVTSMVIPGATYVFAAIERSAVPKVLRVTVGDRTVDAPFADIGAASPVLIAAYAFDEPLPFTAEVVNP
jgi:hypothetical protein